MRQSQMPESQSNRSPNEKKEAIWFGVVAVIALLVLVILHQSGEIVADFMMLEEPSVPVIYWVLIVVCLSLCALVPYLLKDSKEMDFKIIAILLTSVAPIALICFILFSFWRSANPL